MDWTVAQITGEPAPRRLRGLDKVGALIVGALAQAGRASAAAIKDAIGRGERRTHEGLRWLIDTGRVAVEPHRGNETRVYLLASQS